jgi:hypothetical protein
MRIEWQGSAALIIFVKIESPINEDQSRSSSETPQGTISIVQQAINQSVHTRIFQIPIFKIPSIMTNPFLRQFINPLEISIHPA